MYRYLGSISRYVSKVDSMRMCRHGPGVNCLERPPYTDFKIIRPKKVNQKAYSLWSSRVSSQLLSFAYPSQLIELNLYFV